MMSGSPAMWTIDNMSVGMLTSSSAAAISSSDVSNGWPAWGLRMRCSGGVGGRGRAGEVFPRRANTHKAGVAEMPNCVAMPGHRVGHGDDLDAFR